MLFLQQLRLIMFPVTNHRPYHPHPNNRTIGIRPFETNLVVLPRKGLPFTYSKNKLNNKIHINTYNLPESLTWSATRK